MITFLVALVVVVAVGICLGTIFKLMQIKSDTKSSALKDLDMCTFAEKKAKDSLSDAKALYESKYGTGTYMPDWMHSQTQATRLSYEEKMKLLQDLPNPFDHPKPKLTKEEIETKIVEAEEALLEYEDQYASVQADAEVTGDTTEIRALDEAYGECEEALQSYRDMLATVEQKGANDANESMRLIRDLMSDYGIG